MSVPANFSDTYAVVASPAAAAETVIAILSGVGELLPNLAVHLSAAVSLNPDADVTEAELRIRQGSLTGNVVGPQGWSVDFDAGSVGELSLVAQAVDFPGDFAGAVYVLTLQCEDAGGVSTVQQLGFHARVC